MRETTCGDERPERRTDALREGESLKEQRLSERAPREQRPSTRPHDGDIREQRLDAALIVLSAGEEAQAREGALRLHQHEQAPPDILAGQSVVTIELRRECNPEAEAEHAKAMPNEGKTQRGQLRE